MTTPNPYAQRPIIFKDICKAVVVRAGIITVFFLACVLTARLMLDGSLQSRYLTRVIGEGDSIAPLATLVIIFGMAVFAAISYWRKRQHPPGIFALAGELIGDAAIVFMVTGLAALTNLALIESFVGAAYATAAAIGVIVIACAFLVISKILLAMDAVRAGKARPLPTSHKHWPVTAETGFRTTIVIMYGSTLLFFSYWLIEDVSLQQIASNLVTDLYALVPFFALLCLIAIAGIALLLAKKGWPELALSLDDLHVELLGDLGSLSILFFVPAVVVAMANPNCGNILKVVSALSVGIFSLARSKKRLYNQSQSQATHATQ